MSIVLLICLCWAVADRPARSGPWAHVAWSLTIAALLFAILVETKGWP